MCVWRRLVIELPNKTVDTVLTFALTVPHRSALDLRSGLVKSSVVPLPRRRRTMTKHTPPPPASAVAKANDSPEAQAARNVQLPADTNAAAELPPVWDARALLDGSVALRPEHFQRLIADAYAAGVAAAPAPPRVDTSAPVPPVVPVAPPPAQPTAPPAAQPSAPPPSSTLSATPHAAEKIKTPKFWTEEPVAWFRVFEDHLPHPFPSQAACFDRLLAYLPALGVSKLWAMISAPPLDAYSRAKDILLRFYVKTERERAEELREFRSLGDRSPSDALEYICLLYTSPSPRDLSTSRMPSSA